MPSMHLNIIFVLSRQNFDGMTISSDNNFKPDRFYRNVYKSG